MVLGEFISNKYRDIDRDCLRRYFASGTGAAGLVGAFMWWELRGLGVRTGVGISAVGALFTFQNR